MSQSTYPQYSTHYPLLLKTFMKRPVNLYPEHIGMVYRNPYSAQYQRFTWSEWYQRTCRLANVLLKLGVAHGTSNMPGDRIGTMALNTHRHMELYFAVPCSGAVLHCINVRLAMEHIVFTIKHAEDKVIFLDDALLPLVEAIYDQIRDTVRAFVYMSDKQGLPKSKIESLLEYEALLSDADEDFFWPDMDENTYATLCYTTATTGLPKGAMFSHRALYLQTLHLITLGHFSNDPANPQLGENAIPMITTPMFHIHAWGAPYIAVFSALKIVLPGTFTVEGFCDLVQTEKVTSVSVVPTILAMLLDFKDLEKYDLSSLLSVGVGGGALPLGLKEKIEKKISGMRMTSGYGMTETAPVTVVSFLKKFMREWSKEDQDKIRVKTGLAVPGMEVEVVDGDGVPVPHDNQSIGQIVVRGPWVMEEYYKNPEKTAEVWRNGWFHTNDLATVDEDGYLTIADRMSDIIRSGSEMVPTVLLENLVASADFVLEAAVVGVPDEIWGEKALAVIKMMPGSDKSENDLIAFLKAEGVDKGKITKWMLPKLVVIVDEIPKTSVGKFKKMEIRKNIEQYVNKAVSV